MQHAKQHVSADGQLGTWTSLILNMLAQQFNRLLTNPIDVVANVNQGDPNSRGFFHTFVKLSRGGVGTLWRGLSVSLLLSLNPALMFTLVGQFSAFLSKCRRVETAPGAGDMFWISGVSKTIATLVTYPLIRAKAVMQTQGGQGLFPMLVDVARREGIGGLYSGVWMLSYKTVLFNSLMMSLKRKLSLIEETHYLKKKQSVVDLSYTWRPKVKCGSEKPWDAFARGDRVVYVDGSWTFLHEAQEHLLSEASKLCKHLIVGVHSDQTHFDAVGVWPSECYGERVHRLLEHPLVGSVLECAPWVVSEALLQELGISQVVSGSITKQVDCAPTLQSQTNVEDPYEVCKKLDIFHEIPSLNVLTEREVWRERVGRILFSNVDASIDWRILVKEGDRTPWGENPGYCEPGHEGRLIRETS